MVEEAASDRLSEEVEEHSHLRGVLLSGEEEERSRRQEVLPRS